MQFVSYIFPFISILPSSFQLGFLACVILVVLFFFLSFVLWIIRIIRGG